MSDDIISFKDFFTEAGKGMTDYLGHDPIRDEILQVVKSNHGGNYLDTGYTLTVKFKNGGECETEVDHLQDVNLYVAHTDVGGACDTNLAGWGPFLYDLTIEISTLAGGASTSAFGGAYASDNYARAMTIKDGWRDQFYKSFETAESYGALGSTDSIDAINLWKFYATKRPDIRKLSIPNFPHELTDLASSVKPWRSKDQIRQALTEDFLFYQYTIKTPQKIKYLQISNKWIEDK